MSSSTTSHDRTAVEETAALWAAREALNSLTADDRKTMTAWLEADPVHRTAYLAAKNTTTTLGQPSAETVLRNAHRNQLAVETKRSRRVTWRLASALAAGVASISLFLFASDLAVIGADYASAPGEVKAIQLPDGTKLTLDTRTAINVTYTAAAREVSLIRGRAHFEVTHENTRPFTVHVLGGEVRDIGTAFTVSQIEDVAETLVTEGRVEITSASRRATLTAGQGAHWQEGNAPSPATSFNASDALGWQTGTLIINRRPFGEVVEEVNRYRRWPVLLLNDEVAQRNVTGALQADNLNESIAALAQAQGLRTLTLPFTTILY